MKVHTAMAAVLFSMLALASSSAQIAVAKVSGKVSGGDSQPVANAVIEYADPVTQQSYKAVSGQNGEFSTDVPCSTYQVTIKSANGKELFHRTSVVVSANEKENLLNVDLSKASSAPKLTPEQIAAIKLQNSKAMKMNAVITQLNAAMEAKKWDDVAADAKQLVEMDPSNYAYYSALGSALANLEKCDDAVTTLDKGIKLAMEVGAPEDAAAKARAAMAQMFSVQGGCYVKLKKSESALAAYQKALPFDPNPGLLNFNLCATYYNVMVYETKKAPDPERLDAALTACSKALEADPTRANAYFIKGSFLITQTLDQTGNVHFPPEAIAALKKYLELDPSGPYAPAAKTLLENAGVELQ